jgi:hypothetical protein
MVRLPLLHAFYNGRHLASIMGPPRRCLDAKQRANGAIIQRYYEGSQCQYNRFPPTRLESIAVILLALVRLRRVNWGRTRKFEMPVYHYSVATASLRCLTETNTLGKAPSWDETRAILTPEQ